MTATNICSNFGGMWDSPPPPPPPGWIVIWWSCHELLVFTYSLQVEGWQPDTWQRSRIRNYEAEIHVEVILLRLLEATFLEDECNFKSLVIGQCILQKLSENKGKQKLRRTCGSDSWHFWHCLLFSVCTVSLVASVMLSLCAKLSSLCSRYLRERERENGLTYARNCVYLSKIENSSYYQELVSHQMPVCWWIE